MKSAVALLFAGLAAAVPLQKRGVSTVVVVETVFQTSTKWVDANAAAYTQPASSSHQSSTPSTYAAPSTTSSVSAYVAPTTSSTSTSVSVYSTPTPTPSSSTTTSVVPTSTSSTSAAYVTPTTTSTSAYVPTSTSSSAAASATAGTGGSTGETYTGDITYYTPGMGSCGIENTSSDMIVAISHVLMESAGVANPNKNPYCNRTIMISYNGNEVPATVTDTCPGCEEGSIDLTEALFYKVAPSGDGRVHDVKWWFTSGPNSY